MLSGKAANTKITVLTVLTRTGLKPAIYINRVTHANHYTTDVVSAIFMMRTSLHTIIKVVKRWLTWMDFLIATMKHPIKKMMVHHSSQTVVYSPNMANDMACKFVFSEKKIFIYIPS
jgi:hypothetical protein